MKRLARIADWIELRLSLLAAALIRLPEWASAPAVMFGMAWLVFGRLLLRPALMTSGSDFLQFYFWENFTREELAAGRLPLWNPYFFSGYPALANPQMMVFYPPAVLLRLLPLGYSYGIGFMLHMGWAGLGMYWLARHQGLGRVAAVISGMAFMMGGVFVTHIQGGHLEWLYTIAWLPWAVWQWQRVTFERGPSPPWLAGIVSAMMILAGAPKLVILAGLMLSVMGLFWLASFRRRFALRALAAEAGRLALAASIAMGAAAPQLIPMIEFTLLSSRAGGLPLKCSAVFSLNPADLLFLAFAYHAFGSASEWERHGYFGAMGLALAIVGLVSRRRQGAVVVWKPLLIIWGAIGLMFGFGPGLPFYPLARTLVPGLSLMRQPFTFIVMASFAGAGLAGLGCESFLQWARDAGHNRRWPLLVAGMLLALAAISDALLFRDNPQAWDPGLYRWISWLSSFSLWRYLLVGLSFWLLARRPSRTRLASGTVIVFLFVDLWLFGFTRISVVRAYPPGAEATYVPSVDPAEARVLTSPYTYADQSMAAHVANAQGYAPIVLDSYNSFVLGSQPPPQCPGFEHAEIDLNDSDLLRLLSVKYIVGPTSEPIEISGYYPRVLWVGSAVSVDTPQEAVALARAPGFDPSRVVYVEGDVLSEGQNRAGGEGRARIVSYQTQNVTVEVESASPGWLALNDVWYPGWEASVNDEPTPLYRANGAFRAVRVPAGRSTVIMTYHSTYLALGAGITAMALVGMIAAAIRQAIRSKAPPAAPPVQADSG